MIDNLLRYLDLQSENRQPTVMAKNKDRKSVSLPVIPQYIALVLGITIQPYLAAFQKIWTLEIRWLMGLADLLTSNSSLLYFQRSTKKLLIQVAIYLSSCAPSFLLGSAGSHYLQ